MLIYICWQSSKFNAIGDKIVRIENIEIELGS